MEQGVGGGRRCCETGGVGRQRGGGRGALVEPAILAALSQADSHGYDLVKTIEVATGGAVCVDPGGLYRVLRRLEEDGFVASTWVDPGSGPQRREYGLTDTGRSLLAGWLEHLRERQRAFALLADFVQTAVNDAGAEVPPSGSNEAAEVHSG